MKTSEYSNIEDFFFHPGLILLANKNDKEGLNGFISAFPEKEQAIREAWMLIRHLQIEEVAVSDSQIEEDFKKLKTILNNRKKQKNRIVVLKRIVGVAACIVGLLVGGYFIKNSETQHHSQKMLARLDSLHLPEKQIQFIVGSFTSTVENKETIFLTEKGDVMWGPGNKIKKEQIADNDIFILVPYGKRLSVKLGDGSTVWINSESKVVCPRLSERENREVYVDGEVYLDVAKNKKKPFIVHTQNFDIKVLGTQFNVSSYEKNSTKSVVLVNGSVEIDNFKLRKTTKLTPQHGYFMSGDYTETKKVDTSFYTSWMEDIIKLEGETLQVIFEKLSRIYDVTIVCSDNVGKIKYKGKLKITDSLEETLYNISLSTPLTYTKKNDSIIIK